MQISASTATYGASQAQRLLAGLLQTPDESARQEAPGRASGSGGPPSGPPPGPPPGGGTSQFAAQTLGGLLSVQEQPASASDLAARLIQDADGDDDGSLSLQEIQSALGSDGSDKLSAAVSGLDTDGDGKLNADELAAGLEARHTEGGRRHPPSSDEVASKLIGETDGDSDGSLSLEEILAKLGDGASDGASEAFDKLDTNADGLLSSSELSAALDAFRTAHAGGPSNTASSQAAVTA